MSAFKTTLSLSVSQAIGWTSTSSVFAADGSTATYTDSAPPLNNYYFKFDTDAASMIPANAVISGVRIQVRYQSSTLPPQPRISAGPGEFGGPSGTNQYVLNTLAYYTFGSSTDPLGATSVSDVTRISLKFGKDATGNVTYFFDYITVDVHWDNAGAGGGSALFFGELF